MFRSGRREAQLLLEGLEERWVPAGSVFDFGDLPAPYSVTFAENGASHVAIGPFLGQSRDGESDGTHSANASADDNSDSDDEDGVLIFGAFTRGNFDLAVVQTQDYAVLDAWMDFNADGDFDDFNEQIAFSNYLAPGFNDVFFSVPEDAAVGVTYARFRVSSQGGLGPNGAATDGEVEDYQVQIQSLITATGANPQGVLVQGSVGESFTVQVGSFSLAFQPEVFDYIATINWGDGTTSEGVIASSGENQYTVTGTHAYQTDTTFLVSFTVTSEFGGGQYYGEGSFYGEGEGQGEGSSGPSAEANAGAAVILRPNEDNVVGPTTFVFLPPGGGTVQADTEGVQATLTQPDGTTLPSTLFLAKFNDDPANQDAFFDRLDQQAVNSYDVRVTGGADNGQLIVTFDFTGDADDVTLYYFDPIANKYRRVVGKMTVNEETNQIHLVLDSKSLPKISGITGTVFTIAVSIATPSTGAPTTFATTTTTVTPATALAATRDQGPTLSDNKSEGSSGGTTVTFRTSSRRSLSVDSVQDSARAATAALSSSSGEDKKEDEGEEKPDQPKDGDKGKKPDGKKPEFKKPEFKKTDSGKPAASKQETSQRTDGDQGSQSSTDSDEKSKQEEDDSEPMSRSETPEESMDAYFAWAAGAVALLGYTRHKPRRRRRALSL